MMAVWRSENCRTGVMGEAMPAANEAVVVETVSVTTERAWPSAVDSTRSSCSAGVASPPLSAVVIGSVVIGSPGIGSPSPPEDLSVDEGSNDPGRRRPIAADRKRAPLITKGTREPRRTAGPTVGFAAEASSQEAISSFVGEDKSAGGEGDASDGGIWGRVLELWLHTRPLAVGVGAAAAASL